MTRTSPGPPVSRLAAFIPLCLAKMASLETRGPALCRSAVDLSLIRCYCVRIERALTITGLGALSALGTTAAAHRQAVLAGDVPFQRLAGLLGADSPHAMRPAAWIDNRALLTHRKWSPATMAAAWTATSAKWKIS